MGMKKRIAFFSMIGLLVLLLSFGTVILAGNFKDQKATDFGKEIKKEMEKEKTEKGKLLAKVGETEIYQSDIDRMRISYNATGKTLSDEELLNKMVNANIIINDAKKNKIVVSDEEVDEYIEYIKEGMEADPVGKETFNSYLESLEMTIDEYNELCKESYRGVLMTNKLKELVIGTNDNKSANDIKENKDKWIKYTEDLYNKAVEVVYY